MPDPSLRPLTVAITLALAVLILGLPRRWFALPLVLAAVFVPPDQRIIIAGLDWSMMRFLLAVGIVRLFTRGELRSMNWSALDVSVMSLGFVLVAAGTAREASISVFVNRLGQSFDIVVIYLLLRISSRTSRDILAITYAAVGALGALAFFMALEWSTGRNLFSALGSVPPETWIRDGRLRCQGAFAHPIMAGMFGATWLPQIAALWWFGKKRLAIAGGAFSLLVVFFSASSTPILATAVAVVGMAIWPARRMMRYLRWGGLALLVALHLVREKPVWHLLARINVLESSTGWHRYWVIDQSIAHFDEWWLAGSSEISHWHIHWNDVTNQFVGMGLNGGVWATLLLIASLALGFSAMGRAARSQSLSAGERRLSWALGVTLAVHTSAFFAVVYFGQMTFLWNLQLALVGSMSAWQMERARRFALPKPREPESLVPPADSGAGFP